MKIKLGKKLVSLLLAVIMIFSMTTVGITSAYAAEVDTEKSEAVVVSTVVATFAINKALTIGLNGVVKVVDGIGGVLSSLTGVEAFSKVTSFVGDLLVGKNKDGEILDLCKEIYEELQNIEVKMDAYASSAQASSAAAEYSKRVDDMNAEWRDSVTKVLEDNGINTVASHYFEFDDVGNVTGNEANTQIGYFVAAYCYANDIADKYGNKYTYEDVQELRNQLFEDFCAIHGGVTDDMTELDKQKLVFGDKNVDNAFTKTIDTLAQRMNIADSYSDCCAQTAYYCFLDMEDQFDFVRNGMSKQMMQIAIIEMLYQEYLNMRGEYLEENYYDLSNTEHQNKWASYKDDISAFAKLNETVADYMESRISKKLVLDNTEGSSTKGISYAIYEYPHDGDLGQTKMLNRYGYVGDNIKMNMMFDKVAVPTSSGIKMYGILDGSEIANMKTSALTYKYNRNGKPDDYPLTGDGEVLLDGYFSDSSNSYYCPDDANAVESLYSTPLFKLNNSTPSAYLQEYLDYVPSDKTVYQLYSYHYEQEEADGWLTDDHEILTALNMDKSYVDFANNPDKKGCELDGKNLVDSGYKGHKEEAYGSYYCYVVASSNTSNKSKLLYESSDNSEIIVKDKDGNVVTSNTSVVAGTELTLYMKSKSSSKLLNSLKLQKFNEGYSDTNLPNMTSESVIIEQVDFNSLEKDEKGYYKATFYMPYVYSKLVLDTVDGYSVDVRNETDTENIDITINNDQNLYAEGETVQFSLPGNYGKLTLEYGGNSEDVILDYNKISNTSSGSFTMPNSNVTLVIHKDSEMNTDIQGNYLISTPQELKWFADVVNAGRKDMNAILVNDIDMSGVTDFTPIGQTPLYYASNPDEDGNWGYTGTFDGNGYVIKNLSVTGSSTEDTTYGVFGTINGTVKNLGVDNFQYKGYGKDSRVGVITGQILKDGVVTDCYATSSLINTQVGTLDGVTGGIAGANYAGTIENCYTYHVFITAGRAGGIVGDNHGDGNKNNGTDRPGTITNCYTTSENICMKGTSTDDNTANVTKDSFASGEIAYLLNKGVTDGTQIWYQNIGGDNADKYPVQDNTHCTVFKAEDVYTNGYLLGDVDGDGVVKKADFELLEKYLKREAVLTAEGVRAGDVDGNGNTGPADLVKIEAYVFRLPNVDTGNTGKIGAGTFPADAVLMGDVDLNGNIETADLELLQKSVVDVTILSKNQLQAGDIDLNDYINTKDVTQVNMYLACKEEGLEYTGNTGMYSYKGFDSGIVGEPLVPQPTTPDNTTKPQPDNSGATSSTTDNATPDKNTGTTTGNGTVQTGDPMGAGVILVTMIFGMLAMIYLKKRKNG